MDPTSNQQESGRIKVRYWVIAAIATVLLVGVKLIFEHTSWGYQHEVWVFGQLQGLLPQIDLDNPVVVLDISGLPGGKPGETTPRNDLKEIISALANLPSPPRAIAVDINFSPKGPIYSVKDDEAFFDFCLSVTDDQKVPVFLAVAETKAAPPEAWLGNEKYKKLAVAAAGDINDASRIPLWVKSPYSSEKLVSLSYALAREYRHSLPRANRWIRWAVDERNPEDEDDAHQEKKSIEDEATLTYEERLVNYSKLDLMKEAAHPDTKADAIQRAAQKYSERVVILGDLNSSDKVPIPGRQIDQQGSLVLASATYTLIKEPLFEFKGWMRVLLDFTIAAVIIVAVARFRKKYSGDVLKRKQKLFIWATVAVMFLLGFGLVIWPGILWLDFLLVVVALLLHPRAEHWVDRLIEKIRPEDPSPPDVVPPAGDHVAAVTKSSTAALLLCLMALSGRVSAQQTVVSPPRCEKAVAAVGIRLNTPAQKSKKKKPGTCYVRQNRDAVWQPLTAGSAQRQYRAGEHLYCDADCSLQILFCGTQTQQTVDTRKPDWFPVIHAFRSPAPLFDPKKSNFLRLGQYVPAPDPGSLNESEGMVYFSAQLGINRVIDNPGVHARPPASISPTPRPPAASAGSTSVPSGKGDVSPTEAAVPTGAAAARERKFAELLRDANDARANKDYAAAHQLYVDARKIGPDDYRVPEGLGNLYADQKEWNAAEQAYRDALKLRPDRSFLNVSLAYVMLQGMVASRNNSRAPEIEQALQRALASNPSSLAVYGLFEQFWELQDADPSSMEPVLRFAVSAMPYLMSTNLRLAQVLDQLGKPEEALYYIRRAETLVPDRSEPQGLATSRAARIEINLLLVALAYQSNGSYEDAERLLKKALELNPDDPFALYLLGSVMVQRKHFEKALPFLQKASTLGANKFKSLLALGIAQLGSGNLVAAEASFDGAAAEVKDETDGIERLAYWFSALGDAYRSKGRHADAIRSYEKSLKHVADNPDTRANLLEVQRKHKSKTP